MINTISFGEMSLGKSYSKEYVIVNHSDTPTTISNLGHSCSCVTTEVIKGGYVNPNEKAIIKVTATPGSTGMYSKSFWFDFAGKHYDISLKGHTS